MPEYGGCFGNQTDDEHDADAATVLHTTCERTELRRRGFTGWCCGHRRRARRFPAGAEAEQNRRRFAEVATDATKQSAVWRMYVNLQGVFRKTNLVGLMLGV